MRDEPKTDCFLYQTINYDGCRALIKRRCTNCRFYQTEEEYNDTLVKCAKRLVVLDKDTDDYYKSKYGINYEKLTGGGLKCHVTITYLFS